MVPTQGMPQSLVLFCAGDPFHADNRMGLTGTLHRISAIKDRDGSVIGLTYRIGRHVPGKPTSPCSPVVCSLPIVHNERSNCNFLLLMKFHAPGF